MECELLARRSPRGQTRRLDLSYCFDHASLLIPPGSGEKRLPARTPDFPRHSPLESSAPCMRKQTWRASMPETYSLVSLFTGAGALDYAFERTRRFVTRLAVESNPVFCETLQRNGARWLPAATICNADIGDIQLEHLVKSVLINGVPDGIIGGPPCQPFSRMGQKMGTDDPRGQLVYKFHECIDAIRPPFFLMENVPDLATRKGSNTIEALVSAFERSGYTVAWKVLNAADYGAPTKRKRIFVIGFRDGRKFSFPTETHVRISDGLSAGLKPWMACAQALGRLPEPSFVPPFHPQAHQLIAHTHDVRQRFATIMCESVLVCTPQRRVPHWWLATSRVSAGQSIQRRTES